MNWILVVWTVVAGTQTYAHRDWRPIGEFASEAACLRASTQLGVKPGDFRCLYKQ